MLRAKFALSEQDLATMIILCVNPWLGDDDEFIVDDFVSEIDNNKGDRTFLCEEHQFEVITRRVGDNIECYPQWHSGLHPNVPIAREKAIATLHDTFTYFPKRYKAP